MSGFLGVFNFLDIAQHLSVNGWCLLRIVRVDLIPAPVHHGSLPPLLLVSVTCSADYACASSTDTVVAGAFCRSGTCTDDKCCEPAEPGERGAWRV